MKIEAFGLAPTPGRIEFLYRELTAPDEPVCSDSTLRSLLLRDTAEAAAPL